MMNFMQQNQSGTDDLCRSVRDVLESSRVPHEFVAEPVIEEKIIEVFKPVYEKEIVEVPQVISCLICI